MMRDLNSLSTQPVTSSPSTGSSVMLSHHHRSDFYSYTTLVAPISWTLTPNESSITADSTSFDDNVSQNSHDLNSYQFSDNNINNCSATSTQMHPSATSLKSPSYSPSSCSQSVSEEPNEKRRKTGKSNYKHIPHREKPPHLVAKRNARERRRVQAVNSAFARLRKCVQVENRNKRLSKVKTLQEAIKYISKLQEILDSCPPLPSESSENLISLNSEHIQTSESAENERHIQVARNSVNSDANFSGHIQSHFNNVNGIVRTHEMESSSFPSNYLPASIVPDHSHHEFAGASSCSTNKENMMVDSKWIKNENVGARDGHRWEIL
ncbi:uncharacterized protein LOC141855596 [Brevipalpus obovatus]|uniref:uncharacterized protein LOC141855596 n=1 Tax=Brevipalpus obovatus TaxID=246614 RepID=UPI003D9FAD3D